MAKVVLDAVGGDHAPVEAVRGALLAAERGYLSLPEILFVGPEAQVRSALEAEGVTGDSARVLDAPDLLTGEESPTDAMRKKPRSSIAVGIRTVKQNGAGAFISAGSTGTVVAAATLGLRCLEGIRRPAIAAMIHGEKNPFLVLDVGANPQPKPLHLAQYALMGSAYYSAAFGVDRPRVGILNIGSEDLKGNALVKESRALLKQMSLNFCGNIEGIDVFSGDFQVVVCDGFTGNVLLKVSEGVAEYLLRTVQQAMQKVGVPQDRSKAVMGEVLPRVDYSEYGGALLLGVEGIVTICHGRSKAPAFCNAIRFAVKAMGAGVNEHIVRAAAALSIPNATSRP
ncbi:MAG: phosphate acyltransferase PlsX [Planctomycetota bacterium]